MKSFTARSFETVGPELSADMRAAVADDPLALFTDFQWYLHQGRDTVFFTAFAGRTFSKEDTATLVADMVARAPQLSHGFKGATPGRPLTAEQINAITSVETIDDLEGYPDKWIGNSRDLFDAENLPLFRVMVANRREGADADGRAAVIQVRSAHCLLEGSDSALLTRSQSAGHGVLSDPNAKVAIGDKAGGMVRAGIAAFIHMFFAYALSPKDKPIHAKTLAFSRRRLRDLAGRLGVRQRSLYFALVSMALNGEGPEKAMSNKAIRAAYTMVGGKRNEADDDFFRVRALQAMFPVHDDFMYYVKEVDRVVGKIEERDVSAFQMRILAMFGMHRRLNKRFPWLHGERFWRFSGATHLVLTLVPPHRLHGPMTRGMMEPIYCGAYHPATNICTFCPGREYVTFNFTMEQRHIDNVDKISALLERIEAMVGEGGEASAGSAELAAAG
ncbi:hypothetical protein GCM10007989_06530 [Devosia pacifica]|uniref:Uncharacterized protein n=1 Tax=Devosia pacifica TaxID=1335967 RepID=A0A918RVX0_9HYPH|nr:hypothetical protein [Devosia pacifica]GHA14526.1 hypothetical protein GCM10007989_06530 [Devosia pacifica]